jgi:hypothetical protein
MAATLITTSRSLRFRLDTGEMNGSKVIYKSASYSGLSHTCTPAAMASTASTLSSFFALPVTEISVTTNQLLDLG